MIEIVKDINILKQISEPVSSVSEALDIIQKLESTLSKIYNGIGLAAIQIGIPKRIAIISKDLFQYKKPLYLINSKFIEGDNLFKFEDEGCLSFPGMKLTTNRYQQILIENNEIRDNNFELSKDVYYYPLTKEDEIYFSRTNKLACIAIQHEMDHFDGKILPEYGTKKEPIIKIGRNDPCPCGSGKKYKKCCLFNK